jgi:ComEC/Rec2-related protein
MVNFPFYAKNPVFGSAVLFCILVYGGIFHLDNKKQFVSLFPAPSIREIEGTLQSSPKVFGQSSTDFYAEFATKKVRTVEQYSGSTTGTVTIYFNSEIIRTLYEKGVVARISVIPFYQGFKVLSVRSAGWDSGVLSQLLRIRASSRIFLRNTVANWGAAGGFFLALTAGSQNDTERILIESFKIAGLSHILALSGMHLSIFSCLLNFFLKKIVSKCIGNLLNVVILSLFVFFAGTSPSLTRAYIFYLVIKLLKLISISSPDAVSVLSLTFFIQVFIFPNDIETISFILSYLALTGILIISPVIFFYLKKIFSQPLAKSFAESLSAVIVTAPVTIYFFDFIAPASIVSSFFITPLVSVFINLGIIIFILTALVPFLSPIISGIMVVVYTVIKKIVVGFSEIPVVTF